MLFSRGRSGCLLSLGYPHLVVSVLRLSPWCAGLEICGFGQVLALFDAPG
jgi:hypothetical protein